MNTARKTKHFRGVKKSPSTLKTPVVCMFFLLLLGLSSFALDNPMYVTYPRHVHVGLNQWDTLTDTVFTVTYQSAPGYLSSTILDIEFVPNRHHQDSLQFLLDNYVGSFEFGETCFTWYGDASPGDKFSCSFEFRPLRVGTMSFAFDVYSGPLKCYHLHYGFTLNEYGKLVPNPGRNDPVQGSLGPHPSVFGDTLFASTGNIPTGSRGNDVIYVIARVSPVPEIGRESILEYLILPDRDLPDGLSWMLISNDVFELAGDETMEWPGGIQRGDTLRLTFTIEPTKPGIGYLDFWASGFAPLEYFDQGIGVTRGGQISERLTIGLPIGDDAGLLACYRGTLNLDRKGHVRDADMRADSYRLDAITKLDPGGPGTTLKSPSFDVKTRKSREERNNLPNRYHNLRNKQYR